MAIIKCRYCGKVLSSMVAYHSCSEKNNSTIKWKNKRRHDSIRIIKTKHELELERLKCFETRKHKELIRKRKEQRTNKDMAKLTHTSPRLN